MRCFFCSKNRCLVYLILVLLGMFGFREVCRGFVKYVFAGALHSKLRLCIIFWGFVWSVLAATFVEYVWFLSSMLRLCLQFVCVPFLSYPPPGPHGGRPRAPRRRRWPLGGRPQALRKRRANPIKLVFRKNTICFVFTKFYPNLYIGLYSDRFDANDRIFVFAILTLFFNLFFC